MYAKCVLYFYCARFDAYWSIPFLYCLRMKRRHRLEISIESSFTKWSKCICYPKVIDKEKSQYTSINVCASYCLTRIAKSSDRCIRPTSARQWNLIGHWVPSEIYEHRLVRSRMINQQLKRFANHWPYWPVLIPRYSCPVVWCSSNQVIVGGWFDVVSWLHG